MGANLRTRDVSTLQQRRGRRKTIRGIPGASADSFLAEQAGASFTLSGKWR